MQGNRYGARNPRLAPTVSHTVLDIAWAAGVFEGDGHPSRQTGSARASVSQKDDWLPHQLRKLFGGRVTRRLYTYSHTCRNPGDKYPMWDWVIHGARARGFLWSIYGLLSPRRQSQIRKVMEVDPR